MKVLYHLPILLPRLPQAEALSQEIAVLCQHFGGPVVSLNPNQHLPLPLPRLTFGWHRLLELWRRERHYDLHHFFNPDPFPYPILRLLRKPVIYTITGGVARRPNLNYFNRLGAVAVQSEPDRQKLLDWGIRRVDLLRPGIDVARFQHVPLPIDHDVRLLMASAPWTVAQFRSKGISALLAVAQRQARLHLTFLWRKVLSAEMQTLVAQSGVAERVQVIDQLVDVNAVLAQVHATVALADTPTIIKAWPHSLLDSLAAGKPVLISRAIPMASYVAEHGCGIVVEEVTAEALAGAIAQLIANYDQLAAQARLVGQRDFALDTMVASYRQLYQRFDTKAVTAV